MPMPKNFTKRLSRMLAKQESMLSELQSLAETHGGDGEGPKAKTLLMTWASTLEALENAREAMDDLVVTVSPAALEEPAARLSGAAAG